MIIFVVAFYLALIFWTAKDARRRIEDPVIVAVCIATAFFFPFVGVLVYLILRPPEYLADVRERELEIKAMERRLGADSVCPVLPKPGRGQLPQLPALRHQAEAGLPPVQGAARAVVAAVPVLRDGDGPEPGYDGRARQARAVGASGAVQLRWSARSSW